MQESELLAQTPATSMYRYTHFHQVTALPRERQHDLVVRMLLTEERVSDSDVFHVFIGMEWHCPGKEADCHMLTSDEGGRPA